MCTGSYASAAIFVSAISTWRAEHRSFDSVVGIEGQRAVTATSIASATGIPRESIRRKLRTPLKLGFIVEKGRARYILMPGVMQQPSRQAALARGIQQTMHCMNECLEPGVLQWVPAGKTKRSPGNKAGSE